MYKSYPTELPSSSSVWGRIWFTLMQHVSAVRFLNKCNSRAHAIQVFLVLKEAAEPKVGAFVDATLADTPSSKIANIFDLMSSVRIGL